MSDGKIETTQGLCVVALTKHLMEKLAVAEDVAYAKLIDTELYPLLMDPETGLFLETNQYLCEACDMELDHGTEALYDYINQE
ncbi:MAG: hypothetical protein IJ106_13600 [Parasporobacterium sp.]|nr:hypothetical protein [Parasporobacterium sp.]